jgi:hypothetical protein
MKLELWGTDDDSGGFDYRTHAELKAAGISMRNLRGEFIRENAKVELPRK